MISDKWMHVLMICLIVVSLAYLVSYDCSAVENMENIYANPNVYNQSFKIPHNNNFISDNDLTNPATGVHDEVT